MPDKDGRNKLEEERMLRQEGQKQHFPEDAQCNLKLTDGLHTQVVVRLLLKSGFRLSDCPEHFLQSCILPGIFVPRCHSGQFKT
jgi:hypothetical protein